METVEPNVVGPAVQPAHTETGLSRPASLGLQLAKGRTQAQAQDTGHRTQPFLT